MGRVGSGVTAIVELPFFGCTNLAGICFRGSAPSFGESVFDSDDCAVVYYMP